MILIFMALVILMGKTPLLFKKMNPSSYVTPTLVGVFLLPKFNRYEM